MTWITEAPVVVSLRKDSAEGRSGDKEREEGGGVGIWPGMSDAIFYSLLARFVHDISFCICGTTAGHCKWVVAFHAPHSTYSCIKSFF